MSRARGQQDAGSADWVVVTGASSSLARAIARLFAGDGRNVILAGRSIERLEPIADDLRIRLEVSVAIEAFEATDFDEHAGLVDRCLERAGGGLGGVILCHGVLPDQAEAQQDVSLAREAIDTNLSSVVSLCERFTPHLRARGAGFLAVVSSVAGDRGRQSNYLYGCTKAGLNTYLEGLSHRLSGSGVRVVTIKPGYVDTKMTWGLVDLRSPLMASPERVAGDIRHAIRRGRRVVYTPWFWRLIMTAVRCTPWFLFRRTKL